MGKLLEAVRATRATESVVPDAEPPAAPERAPTMLERVRAERESAPLTRAPAVSVEALKEDLAKGGALLAEATRAERKSEGASDEEAEKAAREVRDTALILGDNADSAKVREALAAHVGHDTIDKAMTRAFGQRLMETPIAAPSLAERQEKQRAAERENRSVLPALERAWTGEEVAPREAAPGEVRPWMERIKDLSWASGQDVAASLFTGGAKPLYDLVTSAPEIVTGYATDKDVQSLTEDFGTKAAVGLLYKSGLPDLAASGLDAIGANSYSVSEFADNVRAHPEFDEAAYELVNNKDRSQFEALPFNKLPEMAKEEGIDANRVREAIRTGAPGFEALAGMEDLRDDVLSTQASFLPVSVIRTIQPEAIPEDFRVQDVFKKREAAKPWRGDDQGRSAATLMNAALLTPVGDGKTLMVAPSRFQEALRLANTASTALMNVDVGTETPVFNIPMGIPRAALWMAEEAGVPGAENVREKVEAFKVPTPAGLESMIQSGAYDDWLESAGMLTSDRYANRYDPESTWLSRTLTEIANPDTAGQYLGDTYERLGGDPESATARILGTADVAVQALMPAEEPALLPVMKSASAINRYRRVGNAARELGLDVKTARKAARESIFTGTDPRQAVADSITRATVDGIRDGTLDPSKIPAATKSAVEAVLRSARMPEELLTKAEGATQARIWDVLADRRARILDTAADLEAIGGPVTQALRKTDAYTQRARDLDALVRAGNLSMRDKDLVLRFMEAASLRAVEDGAVATPEEWFARHSWERGVEGEALPAGTLMSRPRTATMFSGGGLVEEGLRGVIDPVYAVEANEAIGAAYKVAHGDHVRIGDVRTTPTPDAGEVDYLHASPVCKDYTKAKVITADGEQPIDIETATATAKAIDKSQPPVFTLENVPAYAGSEAMKVIEDTLTRNGYTYDARVYDAADYGAPTTRKRLLLRAVKDGPLPPPPMPTGRTGDWYTSVEDMIPSLPSDTIPPWIERRMDAMGVNWRNPDRPIIVMGGSVNRNNVPFAYAGNPSPTIKATPGEAHRIILPGGEVKRVTPRAMARITGLPDSFPLPENRALATTIIGNGVPPALSRSVFGPLLGATETVGVDARRAATLPGGQSPLFSREGGKTAGSIEATPTPRPDVNPQGFYSALRRAVDGLKGERFSADQLRATLKNIPGVKADEIEWTGLDRFLATHPKPTKGEVLDWLDENAVVVEEKVLAEPSGQTRDASREYDSLISRLNDVRYELQQAAPPPSGDFSDLLRDPDPSIQPLIDEENRIMARLSEIREARRAADRASKPQYTEYQLPGGTNYREVLFKVPGDKEPIRGKFVVRSDDEDVATFATRAEANGYINDFGTGTEEVREITDTADHAATPSRYHAPHFGPEGENLLAHTRVSDRTGLNGEKILHVEEIQSDWHQAGREKGYKSTSAESVDEWLSAHSASGTGRQAVPDEDGRTGYFFTVDGVRRYLPNIPNERGHIAEADAARRAFAESEIARFRVPDAPFAKNWHELVLKRILRMAADGGYDGVSWTTGVQQVKRYEDATRSAVDEIRYTRPKQMGAAAEQRFQDAVEAHQAADDEVGRLIDEGASEREVDAAIDVRDAAEAEMEAARADVHAAEVAARSYKGGDSDVEVIGYKNGRETYRDTLPPEKLPDVLGKEIARKIVDSPDASGSLTGPDLTVGGEGMKGFYDRMLPQFLDKYAKKWGARPIDTSIATLSGESAPVHYLPIPNNMRASILTEGQPLFQRERGTVRGAISPTDPRTVSVPNPDYAAWQAKEAALAAEVVALRKGAGESPNPEWATWDAERARLASTGGAPANEPVPDWVAEAWRQDRGIYALQKYAGIGYNRAATLKAEVEAGRMTWADAVNAARSEGPFAAKGTNPALAAHMAKEPTRTIAGIPNPDRVAWEAKGKATAAEVEELKRAGSKELADLQARRESLQKNPRADDPDWEAEVEEVNDRIGEIVRATSVNPALVVKEAKLAALRANPPPRMLAPTPDPALAAREADLAATRAAEPPREIAKPDDVSRWLIKLFRTGDVKTAFHEGTHLLDLMMGEGWTRKAMEALGYDPTGPITTEVRERIAEAGTRALRGTLRPGTQLGNLFEDFRDTIGDIWRRVKREPSVTTPAFRKLWDRTFAPDDAEMMIAAHLVDARQDAPLGRVVRTSGDAAEEIRQGAQRAAGQRENAANVMRAEQEVRQALGLSDADTEVPVGDLLSRAIAYTATTHALRGWGFGDLEGLTARTAVPPVRAARIRRDVAAYRKALLGGKEAPRPVLVNGREVFTLNRDQQTGVRRMLADLADEPIGVDLPERLQDPNADLSQITPDEWANIVDRQLEVRAGAGAWRDRLTERAAVSGAVRLGQMAMDAARSPESDVAREATKLRDMFVTTTAADEYANPAQREVLNAVAREIGEAGSRTRNAVLRVMDGKTTWQDAFRDVAASLPPEVVPVEELQTLRRVQPVADADNFDAVAVASPEIHRLFTRAPVASTEQTVQEWSGLAILDKVNRRMREDGMDFGAAISDAGHTLDEVSDAMARVQEGIRRRAAVVEQRGAEILRAFAGSEDDAVLAGMDPVRLRDYQHRAYGSWYAGDWADNLRINTELGLKAASEPGYDPGVAALNVLIRLEAQKSIASLTRRLADVGVVADPAQVLRGGPRMDRPYAFGSAANDAETITGQAYTADVQHYIEAITGWKTTSTFREATESTDPVFIQASGWRGPSGSVNKAAYSDALRILQSWGFKTGKGTAWTTMDLADGGQLIMPDMFREPIEKALEQAAPLGGAFTSGTPKLGPLVPGIENPPSINYTLANKALAALGTGYAYSFGMLKTGLTTGIGPLIRPGFFIGNFFGGMLQLYQGVGAVDAIKIMSRPLLPTADGRTARAVIARMWNNGEGLASKGAMYPAEMGFFDAAGRWYSDQAIAEGANRAGLNSSLVKSEFHHALVEDIKAAEPTTWNRLMDSPGLKAAAGAVVGGLAAGPGGAAVGAAAFASLSKTWQDFIREAATGIDNYYRVSTYIDGLKKGLPEQQAAEVARRVAFDYNNLTEFEKNYLRKGVLFYSYQRNNQNLFWWTLLNHPSRIMVQLRALRGMQQENLGEDSELFMPTWGEGRAAFGFRRAFGEGHTDQAMRGAVALTPRLPVADAIGLWQSLLATTTELDPAAAGDLGSRLNPWIQALYVLPSGVDPHSQRSIEGFNTIPNWFVEMDENLTGGMLVNGVFNKVQAKYTNPAQEGYPGAPQWIVKPDGPHARAWWVFRQMTMGGAALDTITAMQRADFGDTLVEGGLVQGAVDLSRDVAEARGEAPYRIEPDTEMARSGLTEAEELGSWLGIKPVQAPKREQALAPMIRRREAEQKDKMRTLQKESEVR